MCTWLVLLSSQLRTCTCILWYVLGTCVSKLDLAEARTLPRQAWNRISTCFFWWVEKEPGLL